MHEIRKGFHAFATSGPKGDARFRLEANMRRRGGRVAAIPDLVSAAR